MRETSPRVIGSSPIGGATPPRNVDGLSLVLFRVKVYIFRLQWNEIDRRERRESLDVWGTSILGRDNVWCREQERVLAIPRMCVIGALGVRFAVETRKPMRGAFCY